MPVLSDTCRASTAYYSHRSEYLCLLFQHNSLMLLGTYYSRNYASIICQGLVGMQGSDSQKVGRAQILRMWAGLRVSESGQGRRFSECGQGSESQKVGRGADSRNVGRAQSLRKWRAQIPGMWVGLKKWAGLRSRRL